MTFAVSDADGAWVLTSKPSAAATTLAKTPFVLKAWHESMQKEEETDGDHQALLNWLPRRAIICDQRALVRVVFLALDFLS